MRQTPNDPFYAACMEACNKLDKKKQFGTYAYNLLKECGLVDHILNGILDLNSYSDSDLKAFDGIGDVSIEIIRAAWTLYSRHHIDPAVLHGYSTGKDVIQWIKEHKLENKTVYYAGHDCVGFITENHEFEGTTYHTCGDLNILTGDYTEYADALFSS